MTIEFPNPLPIRTVVVSDGQAYHSLGELMHGKADGSWIMLQGWWTVCPKCQSEFELKTTTKFEPTRHCEKCRRGRKQ